MDEKMANESYLEAAKEEFDGAIELGKVFQATAVVERLLADGFTKEAHQLREELLALKATI